MTLFPIGLLVLALLTFVVGVAEGSTTLDYLSIIASGVAFVLVLVLGRFGRARRKAAAALPEGPPRAKRPPRGRRAPVPDLFAGYEQLRMDDSFLAGDALDDDDGLDRFAESPVPTSAFGVGEIRLQATSGTRTEPYEPGLSASSPLARILQSSQTRETEPFSGPPTEAVAAVGGLRARPRIFDREIDEPSLSMPYEPPPEPPTEPDDADFVDEPMFPIADYDDLRIDEIVPLLPELEADEIDVVRARERAGANRAIILRRLDVLEARLNEEDAEETGPSAPSPADTYGRPSEDPTSEPSETSEPPERPFDPTPISTPPRTYSRQRRTYGPQAHTDGPPEPPPESVPPLPRPAPETASPGPARRFTPAQTPPAPASTPSTPETAPSTPEPPPPPPGLPIPTVQRRTYGTRSPSGGPAFSEVGYTPLPNREAIVQAEPGNPPGLPIEDYDQLRVIDILAALSELDDDEVERVRRYEVAGACRAPILRQIELPLRSRGTRSCGQ